MSSNALQGAIRRAEMKLERQRNSIEITLAEITALTNVLEAEKNKK